MTLNIFENDAEVKAWALEQWANTIETGNRSYSASDYKRTFGKDSRPLNPHEQGMVSRLRRLAAEERQGGRE